MGIVLIVILFVLFVGSSPYTGWHQLGWGPSGGIGLIVVILIILLIFGRL